MIPEILRSPLLDIVLSIKLLMLGDINSYLSRCVEPPTDVAIQEAIYLLKVKNALDMEENITPLGSIVARSVCTASIVRSGGLYIRHQSS